MGRLTGRSRRSVLGVKLSLCKTMESILTNKTKPIENHMIIVQNDLHTCNKIFGNLCEALRNDVLL